MGYNSHDLGIIRCVGRIKWGGCDFCQQCGRISSFRRRSLLNVKMDYLRSLSYVSICDIYVNILVLSVWSILWKNALHLWMLLKTMVFERWNIVIIPSIGNWKSEQLPDFSTLNASVADLIHMYRNIMFDNDFLASHYWYLEHKYILVCIFEKWVLRHTYL